MNRLIGKRVLITGASAGIGEACARAFAAQGAHLVLTARRVDRIQDLARELVHEHGVDARAFPLDVSDRAAIEDVMKELEDQDLQIDILLNNAGQGKGFVKIHEGDPDDWDETIDTNVKGLLYMTRAILPQMVARDAGHVINLGSIAGRWTYPKAAVYSASKFAVGALTEAINMDLLDTHVRVSSVDPGLTETEFSGVRFKGDMERAQKAYAGTTTLTPADVADAVTYVANAPAHVNVFNLVLMPTDQRHAMLIHRVAT
ncbi:MAG TPA: SDR family NAD(P)-dependent oxidoreductase [Longimicrobiales bacterium]|nr:SDR family NAD(P)-dependent oxidoreductase [Longimicrobiales bacterium]